VNFHTARADVEALPEIVVGTGRVVAAEMRPGLSYDLSPNALSQALSRNPD
jgi:hypothetical protein